MRENMYQAQLKNKLKKMFPGCIVLKNDTSLLQGFPDRTILYNDRWGVLECKAYKEASIRPNQEYYIDLLNSMSFASFIYPENEKEVLDGLQFALRAKR